MDQLYVAYIAYLLNFGARGMTYYKYYHATRLYYFDQRRPNGGQIYVSHIDSSAYHILTTPICLHVGRYDRVRCA